MLQIDNNNDCKIVHKFRHVSQPSALRNFYGQRASTTIEQDTHTNQDAGQTSRNSARISLLINNFDEILEGDGPVELRQKQQKSNL